jgi:hypothetical protein
MQLLMIYLHVNFISLYFVFYWYGNGLRSILRVFVVLMDGFS